MNSQKVTVNNQSGFKAPDETVLVKGKFYNELRNDVETLENSSDTNAAAITINAGNIAGNTAAIIGQYSGALTDGAPTDAELDAAIGLTPATAGAGFRCTVIDTDGTALVYLVASDGTNWWYTVLTAAV